MTIDGIKTVCPTFTERDGDALFTADWNLLTHKIARLATNSTWKAWPDLDAQRQAIVTQGNIVLRQRIVRGFAYLEKEIEHLFHTEMDHPASLFHSRWSELQNQLRFFEQWRLTDSHLTAHRFASLPAAYGTDLSVAPRPSPQDRMSVEPRHGLRRILSVAISTVIPTILSMWLPRRYRKPPPKP